MRVKDKDITLDNYQRELKHLPHDVLDEVRAAIMDGVEIGEFLERHDDNPFVLQQIRVSMKAGVPYWMLLIPYPSTLRQARELYFKNISLDSLERLVVAQTGSVLHEKYWETQVDLISSGAVIPKWLKLEDIPHSLLSFTGWAIKGAHNVEGIVTKTGITPEYAMECLKIRIKGQDIDKFLTNQWHFGVLDALENIASKPYYGHIVRLLDSKSLPDTVTELIALGSKGFPFTEHDLTGLNSMQLSWIYAAHMERLDFSKMLNAELSQRELLTIYNDLYLEGRGTSYLL